MRSLVKSWKSGEPGDANGSYLTWLLRDVFTGVDLTWAFGLQLAFTSRDSHILLPGGSIEAHILFCVSQGRPAVSILVQLNNFFPSHCDGLLTLKSVAASIGGIALMEFMEDFSKVHTNPVAWQPQTVE